MDQTDSSKARQNAEGGKVAITLRAETDALQGLLKELEADLAAAPQEVRQLALDLLDLAPELADVKDCPTSGAGVAILLEPSQWLLDLAAAVRAGDLDWLRVEHSHKRSH